MKRPVEDTSSGSAADVDVDTSDTPEPRFLGAEHVDQLAGMVVSLGMELAVTRLRVALQEARLEAMGVPPLDAETQHRIEAEVAEATDALVRTLVTNLLPERSHARPLVEEQFRSSSPR